MRGLARRGPKQIALPGTPTCRMPQCGQPRSASGSFCTDCSLDVARMLDADWLGDRDLQLPASIPRYWERVDAVPSTGSPAQRRAPGFRSTPPCELDAVVMRDRRSRSFGVVPVWWPARAGDGRPDYRRPHFEAEGEPRAVEWALITLAGALWEHLGLVGPLLPSGAVTRAAVPALCAWLLAHVDDITAHPDAEEIAGDLAELQQQLRDTTGDPEDGEVGRCRELVTVQGQRDRVLCNHPLYMPPPKPGITLDPRRPVMRCDGCDRPYTHLELLRMELMGATS